MLLIFILVADLFFLHLNDILNIHRAKASLPGFTVLPLRQFGSWGPEITTKFDPQKDTYVLVSAVFLLKDVISIRRYPGN